MFLFDQNITVTRLESDQNTFSTNICSDWNIGTHPNGGYLVCLMANAISKTVSHPHPLVVSATFILPVEVGPAIVVVEIMKKSTRNSHAMAKIIQDNKEKARMTATFTDLSKLDSEESTILHELPKIAPLSQCVDDSPQLLPFLNFFDKDAPKGSRNIWGYLKDGRDPDPLFLAGVCDFIKPVVLDLSDDVGWVPTIQYTVLIRQIPSKGPLRIFSKTKLIIGNYLDTDTEVYDFEGKMVAQGKQIAVQFLKTKL